MSPALRLLLVGLLLAGCSSPAPADAPDASGPPDTGRSCPGGRISCHGACVDGQTDPDNCGGCGNVCGASEECVEGSCAAPDCTLSGCNGGFYCDSSSKTCKPGCSGGTGCPASQQCDEASHACVCKGGYKACSPSLCVPAADTCPAPACSTGRTLCNDQCVDLWTDPRHCGACDQACDPGEVCKGTCQQGPDCRTEPCGGLTWCDKASGICKPGCNRDAQCDASERCDLATHACVCSPGQHRCGGVCVSDASPSTCGSRCEPCAFDPHGNSTCSAGACGIACLPGFHSCSGACVANASTSSCGASCTPCPSDPHGQATCDGTSCAIACDTGYHLCGGACVSDTSVQSCGTSSCTPCPTDPLGRASCDGGKCSLTCNSGALLCGGACRACPGGTGTGAFACSGDTCVATTCSPGYHLCGTACASNTAPATCGTSCTACPGISHGSATCDGTSCGLACDSGYRMCGGACAACPTGAGIASTACSGSACVVATCASGYHLCNGVCSSNTAPATCGSSCTPCPTTANGYATCNGATCGLACNSSYLMCGTACTRCPSGGGVLATACAQNACVATSCAAGSHNCGASGCCSTWNTETLRSFGGYLGDGNTVVAPDGTMYVTACENYSDGTPHGGYLGIRPPGGAWGWTKVADNCQKLIVRRDPSGTMHLVAEERWTTKPSPAVHYGTWNGASVAWTKLSDGAQSAAFELDSKGQPLVVYLVGGAVWLASKTGGTWGAETFAATGTWPSLSVAPGDVPAVAYWDSTASATVLATRPGSWQFETLPPTLSLSHGKLLYDAGGAPAVAGFHSTDKALYVGRKVGGSWTRDTLATGYCSYCSATFVGRADPFGRLRGAFFDASSVLKWAEFNGSSWTLQDLPAYPGVDSVDFDSSGKPYVMESSSGSASSTIQLAY